MSNKAVQFVQLLRSSKREKRLGTVILFVTSRCNAFCKTCFYHEELNHPGDMSPEQCSQDKAIDARSDIYSFGVILYEMLVGHVPFTGDSPTIIMMKHLQDPVPSVLEERSDVPPAVGRVVARAMLQRAGLIRRLRRLRRW